ncbi:MAG: hypothetical protein A2579_08820 [Lysobacterales bacterium RIFOXYD1_FULL_69_11]|nr:MAG: hypothetical protein A2190_07020 [Xanthomonadales bacterium RIFOXYA1_FULL_69_10]OHE87507.1 MAG: hypothetical protein A2579_08820 [Xanthomonadales bacterium RIFOXYD1_FULL_69_11]
MSNDAPAHAHEPAPDAQSRHGATANPYYAGEASTPDLDAGAPVLRSSDVQRLNRKALLFLAGIVFALLAAAFWLLGNAGDDASSQPRQRQEAVVIPALPDAPPLPQPAPAAVAPVALVEPPPELPPLPPAGEPFGTGYGAETPARALTLLERRMRDGGDPAAVESSPAGPWAGMLPPGTVPTAATADTQATDAASASAARPIRRPDTLLVRGTYIRCVLETRIVTDVAGFTSCIVTEPVYSINGRRLLIPKGSKVLGRYSTRPTGPRVEVVWDRITTPTGLDVAMSSPGVDNLGSAGHSGHYSAHWGQRIASALLISLISDAFKYAAAEEGPRSSEIGAGGVVVQSPYESTTARTMERLANQALETSRPPTVTIHQGTVVNVYVARDVDFSGVVAAFQ